MTLTKNTRLFPVFGAMALILLSGILMGACSILPQDAATGGKVTLTVGDGSSSAASRTIQPDANLEIASYRLMGGLSGSAQTILGSWDSLDSNSVVSLDAGTWDFTLLGYDSEGNNFLSGSKSGVVLSGSPVYVDFVLSPLEDGEGDIAVTVEWPSGSGVASMVPTFDGTVRAGMSVASVTTATWTFTAQAGGYYLFLELRNASDTVIALIQEYVLVRPNMTSKATITLTAEEINAAPAAPSGLTAQSAGGNSDAASGDVTLTWADNSRTEEGFEVQYSADAGSTWTVLADDLAPATAETAGSAPRGSTRLWRVRAFNTFGTSAWSDTVSYTVPWLVQFETDGGTEIAAQEIASGSLATDPGTPERSGDIFGGWYADAGFTTPWTFTTPVDASRTLYAAWTSAIVFKANFGHGTGSGTMATLYPAEGATVTLPACTFTRTGYTFAGWSLEELGAIDYADQASFTMEASGKTLYARWIRSDATASTSFTYTTDTTARTVSISKYNGTASVAVVIPDLIGGYPVVDLVGASSSSTGVFYSKKPSSLYLPEALKNLGGYALYGNTVLASLDFSQTRQLATIGTLAVYNCTILTSLSLPEGLETIGTSAFNNGTKLASVSLPSTLKTIGSSAFANCTSLVNLAIAEGVETLGDSSFSGCTALTTVDLPDSLQTIGANAFDYCYALKTLSLGSGLTSIGGYAFRYTALTGALVIPDQVTSIGNYAFTNLDGISSLTLGSSVQTIGNYAFNDCDGIAGTLSLPTGLASLGNYAFYDCDGFTGSLVIPDSVTTVGSYAFAGIDTITSLKLGKNLTTIGDYAFQEMDGISGTLTIPDKVTTIGASAFAACDYLSGFKIGVSVTSIGDNAFDSCDRLQSMVLPDTVTTLGTQVFYNCIGLVSADLGEGITSVPDYSFYNCVALSDISMGSKVTGIGVSAFAGCTSLGAMDLPDTVTTLGNYAFSGCTNLVSMDLGTSLKTLGRNVFDSCQSLEAVSFPDSLTSVSTGIFASCYALEEIHTGNGLTTIPDSFFQNCTKLVTVELGSGIASIATYAFQGCTSLKEIDMPTGVTSVASYAFQGCTALAEASFPSTLTSIATYAFQGCTALTAAALPANLSTLGTYAFADCTALASLSTGDLLATVSDYAFANCTSLASVSLGSGVRTIGDYAFSRNQSLTTLDLAGTTTIETFSFQSCKNLTTVHMGSTMASIGNKAFLSCTSLSRVVMDAATPPTLGSATVFTSNAASRYFEVPDWEDNSVIAAYKAAANWSDLSDWIVEQ